MLINFENSAVATGLGKVSFHSNPKERQCQECSKLPYNCTPLTCQYSNAENSPSQAPIVHEGELPDVQAGFRKGRGTRDPTDEMLFKMFTLTFLSSMPILFIS